MLRARSCGAAGDDLRLEEQLVGGDRRALDLPRQHLDGGPANGLDRLADRRQRRVRAAHERGVVISDHRDVGRHGEAGAARGADRAERQRVAGADDARGAAGDQSRRSRVPALEREPGALYEIGGELLAVAAQLRGLEGGEFPQGRHVVGRPEDQADPLVAQIGEVRIRLLHRDRVVGRDSREVEMLRRGVDEDDRQAQLQQPRVVVVRRVGFRVLSAREDHPRHLPLEQHLDVLGLRHAARAGAEDRVEPALRKRAGDDLGERREDRVLQLGDDQADHPRPAHPKMRGPLVADHVERSQHGGTGRVGNAGLAVQDATDRRLADPGLLRDVCKPPRHAATLRQRTASLSQTLGKAGGARLGRASERNVV